MLWQGSSLLLRSLLLCSLPACLPACQLLHQAACPVFPAACLPTVQERQTMVDNFNAQPSTFIFLISTLAGGTGLNLTGANKVVIFDPR